MALPTIPANGFYEWAKLNDGKQPMHIQLRDRRLWRWRDCTNIGAVRTVRKLNRAQFDGT